MWIFDDKLQLAIFDDKLQLYVYISSYGCGFQLHYKKNTSINPGEILDMFTNLPKEWEIKCR